MRKLIDRLKNQALTHCFLASRLCACMTLITLHATRSLAIVGFCFIMSFGSYVSLYVWSMRETYSIYNSNEPKLNLLYCRYLAVYPLDLRYGPARSVGFINLIVKESAAVVHRIIIPFNPRLTIVDIGSKLARLNTCKVIWVSGIMPSRRQR